MLRKVLEPVYKAGVFAIIADETGDVSRAEQLSLCLRYVDETGKPNEVFVGFLNLEDLKASSIAAVLLKRVTELGLQYQNLVAQVYDGAAAMSSEVNGVHGIIKQQCPHAVFVHCFSPMLEPGRARVENFQQNRARA